MKNLFKRNKHRLQVVRQHDSMQCGVACLAMICGYYGSPISLETLGQYCFATNQGVSLKGIMDAAKTLGFETLPGKTDCTDLAEMPLPCILYWNTNHFVVLYKVDRNGTRFWIADPGKGKYKLNLEEFKEHWISTRSKGRDTGIALFLEPGPDFGHHIEAAGGEKRSLRFLLRYMRQYRRYFVQILLGMALGSVLQLAMPFLTQWIVDFGHGSFI